MQHEHGAGGLRAIRIHDPRVDLYVGTRHRHVDPLVAAGRRIGRLLRHDPVGGQIVGLDVEARRLARGRARRHRSVRAQFHRHVIHARMRLEVIAGVVRHERQRGCPAFVVQRERGGGRGARRARKSASPRTSSVAVRPFAAGRPAANLRTPASWARCSPRPGNRVRSPRIPARAAWNAIERAQSVMPSLGRHHDRRRPFAAIRVRHERTSRASRPSAISRNSLEWTAPSSRGRVVAAVGNTYAEVSDA